MLNDLLAKLKSKLARDLAWSVFSPSIMVSNDHPPLDIPLTNERIDLLKKVDNHHLDYQIPDYPLLGNYFETLWRIFFEIDHEFELIAHNQQVISDKKTLGEADFIIKNTVTHETIHAEVACKFYLFYEGWEDESPDNLMNWIGPNVKDSLGKKWRHMQEHQIQLLKRKASKNILSELGIQNIHTSIIMKGNLFSLPPTPKNNLVPIHPYYGLSHLEKSFGKDQTLLLLEKRNWLNTYHLKDEVRTINLENLKPKLLKLRRPIMVASYTERMGYYNETERAFVCPDNWPGVRYHS